ncbi:MAG: type III pantothenate kinase [Chloroflexi bacterium]|nr:type III pantothenate kinase [Chloroflexota bacterium]
MLLAIEIGNSNLKLALFDGNHLRDKWRLATKVHYTAVEQNLRLAESLLYRGFQPDQVLGCVISSVVPQVTAACIEFSRRFLSIEPVVVEVGLETGMEILYDDPAQLGVDRFADAVAAFHLYGAPLIVIDFGTATTFNVVNSAGAFAGGAIAPGLALAARSLERGVAQLPRIELAFPPRAIGTNTAESMQSGLLYGYIGWVEKLIRRLKDELAAEARVVATGGLVNIIAPHIRAVDIINEDLTVEGLRLIWQTQQQHPRN